MILGVRLFVVGCTKKQSMTWASFRDPERARQLKQFVAEKKLQANAATNEAPPGFAPFFAAVETGNWLAVNNTFEDFRKHARQDDYMPGGRKYARRAQHAADVSEKERMHNEAGFASRQASALCPYSPEAVLRYVDFLRIGSETPTRC